MKKHLLKRFNEDYGFMGPTHALSGVAVFLLIAAFLPTIVTELTGGNLYVLIGFGIAFVGSCLLPDFDNVKATVISVLGIVGKGLSNGMRAIARVIYSVTRSKYDKPGADPHRGFWHTIVAGLMTGGLLYLLITATDKIKFTIIKYDISIGLFILWFLLLIFTQIIFAVFFKKVMRKLTQGILGSLTTWIIGGVISGFVVINIPVGTDFKWIGIAIAGGWITHILGDTLTTSGTPLLFPIPHKGHRWWSHRLPPYIKANGPVEHYIFIPLFSLLIVLALAKILIF